MAKLLCVYCSSSDRIDPKYAAVATALGTEMVRQGWDLVYGGGKTGLMGATARAVKAAGGLKKAPAAIIAKLKKASARLSQSLVRHERLVAAMRQATEGLVKAVVEGHRGRVDVASTPNHGSPFTISLPVAS